MRRFVIYWVPVIVACVAIFIQSSLPGPDSLPDVKGIDKIGHAFAYGVLALLFYRAFGSGTTIPFGCSAASASILAAGLYGMSDEIHQYFVPSRHADLLDAAADFAGAAMAVGIGRLFFRIRRPAGG